MNEDRFNIRFFFSQYQSALDKRVVQEYLINPQIGLHRKVEFVGWVPIIRMSDPTLPDQTMGTLGDILGDLNFELKKFWYRTPLVQKDQDTLSYLNLYLGFNFATGPKQSFADGFFYPYSVGVGDFRWGFLWGNYTKRWEWFLNFMYTYAARDGETFFPVEGKLFYIPPKPAKETEAQRKERLSRSVIFFNLHKVFIKWFWPGPSYGEWPMRDDFIVYNFNFSYWLEGFPVLLKHKLMIELNGLQNFNPKYCMRLNQLDLTTGVMTRFYKGAKTYLCVSLPLVQGLYKGPKWFVGVTFSL